MRGLAEEVGVAVSEVTADPGHPIERLAGLVARTDFAAVYLALALGLDPAVSPHVADLRDRTPLTRSPGLTVGQVAGESSVREVGRGVPGEQHEARDRENRTQAVRVSW